MILNGPVCEWLNFEHYSRCSLFVISLLKKQNKTKQKLRAISTNRSSTLSFYCKYQIKKKRMKPVLYFKIKMHFALVLYH